LLRKRRLKAVVKSFEEFVPTVGYCAGEVSAIVHFELEYRDFVIMVQSLQFPHPSSVTLAAITKPVLPSRNTVTRRLAVTCVGISNQ
jgi:hypothetical protein